MKRILLGLSLMLAATMTYAQGALTGKIVDNDSGEPVMSATVSLLKTDSTMVTGVASGQDGTFSLRAPSNGRYIVRITYVGYLPQYRSVSVSGNQALGTFSLKANAILLKGAEVTKNAAKVTVKDDTFMYNAAAYRTPEGSVMEELVKKVPGAEVSDDGTLKINGKEVKKIKVDGKEFFTGDTKTAMKNLPTSVIERLKVYDEKSDLSKVTGIDDGNETTVLDVQMKRGMNRGTFGNIMLGYGTEKRYSTRAMAATFKDNFRLMAMGNANNVNDRGFPGGGGRFGGGRQGLTATKMGGLNFNYEKKDKLKWDGSVRWNHSDGDAYSKTASENFVATAGSFANSISQRYSRSNSWNANMRVEWKPDTMTNITFRPTASWSTSDGLNTSTSASFNKDPYLYLTDPLTQLMTMDDTDSIRVNFRNNRSLSYSKSTNMNGQLQLNRKLSSDGRNLTLRLTGGYSDSKSNNLSTSQVTLYQLRNYLGTADSTYFTNRYNLTPSKTWNYTAQLTYSEPIMKATFLQFSYQFEYRHNESDRNTYDFSDPLSLAQSFFNGGTMDYRQWDTFLGPVGNWQTHRDDSLSRYSQYDNYIHELSLQLRVIREKYNFNVGVRFEPQSNKFRQDYFGVDTTVTRNVLNWSPTLDFRYRFSKISNLRINYRGRSSQPSISQMLIITDNSDPLNITMGNPSLKPSFTNSFNFWYNNYIEKHQRAIMANLAFSTTSNSISNLVTYNEQTGGRITRPENISGNWNTNGRFMFNTAVDTAGYWNVNTWTDFGYEHRVGYVSLDRKSSSQRNTTFTTTVGERLAGSYRNSWIEVELNGALNYTHTRNLLQTNNNLDTWQFSYGGSIHLTAPWGTQLNTSMNMNSRRGYTDKSLNTNELIWNAQISHSFLRGKPLSVMLQFYDILQRQSNFSRSITAMSRSDVEYNAINSYVMLSATYRFNLFGTKEMRQNMRRGPEGDGARPEGGNRRSAQGMRPAGGPGGGFGGGRF